MAKHDKESLMQHESFLSRWSERKLNQRNERNETASTRREEELAPSNESREQGVMESAELPSIDSLDEKSDYSAFFSPDVSDELQRLAMRKLFSNNRFNVRDGLDDYDEDYRSFESLGKTITAEMRHRMDQIKKQDQHTQNGDSESDGEEATLGENEQDVPPLPDSSSSGKS